MSTRKRSTKTRTLKAPRMSSSKRGVPDAGGARVPQFDVLGGFHGIRSALRRQIGVCEKCIIRDAGREAGLSFVRTARGSGRLSAGQDGFEQALRSCSASGFGDFRVERLDWKAPLVELHSRDAFEGRAFLQHQDLQSLPVCDYSAGMLEGILSGLLAEEVSGQLRVVCRETRCIGAGAEQCHFVAGSWSAASELSTQEVDHKHGERRSDLLQINAVSQLGTPVLCDVVDRNETLELKVADLGERVSDYERLLSNILMSSADAIISMDKERRILTWNHGAELMYGYRAEEIVGQSFERLVPEPLLRSGELNRIERELNERGSLRHYETERLTRDGRCLSVDVSATPIRDSRGRVLGRSVIHRDVSERKRFERELIQSEKLSAIGKLSAHVAHEVRNPLSSIRLNLELLADECQRGGKADFEEAKTLLEAIQHEVEVLSRFTDEYLQFARVPLLHRDEVDLGGLVCEMVDLIREEAERASIQVSAKLEQDLPEVRADAAKLRQVLLNLARNAIEAMNTAGGALAFELLHRDGWLELSVRDSGPGINPQVLPRIFEPFFTTKEDGTGLGLALAQQILREHGGSLQCTSQPGQGATFTMRFPAPS